MRLSVVVPVLDEAGTLDETVERLARRRDLDEVVVVDASRGVDAARFYTRPGSPVVDLAARGWRFVGAPAAGRARQMNLGASLAGGELILFLHADTRLPDDDLRVLLEPAPADGWGRFDVRLDDGAWWARTIAFMMNVRSAVSGVCTGDQAIFASRVAWRAAGGFADIPLMEDIEFSRRMKAWRRPYRVRRPVVTSARRWRQRGVTKTILLMWKLRFLYWLGVDPGRLARMYRHAR